MLSQRRGANLLRKQKVLLKWSRKSSLSQRAWANKRRNKDANQHKKINLSNRKLKLPIFTTILILLRKQKGKLRARGRQQKPWKHNWGIKAILIGRLFRNRAASTITKASRIAQQCEIRKTTNLKNRITKLNKIPKKMDSPGTLT